MEANSPFIFALIGAVVGFLIGLLCYRLASKGERQRATLKQALLEREHQIAELKKAQGRHVGDVRQCLEAIRSQADDLEDKLDAASEQWELARHTATPEAPKTKATGTPTPPNADAPVTPRDYADGKNGTLSEEYGLKESKAKESAVTQPPRY
ncbi:ZapG family protein [Halomonas sp. HNIBRBA4712]|uniref:ZapG family protein n=1 Tax=Halomonas sp. HNIBRBA4712 TaxID=3373087 RepID=UPI003745FB8E